VKRYEGCIGIIHYCGIGNALEILPTIMHLTELSSSFVI